MKAFLLCFFVAFVCGLPRKEPAEVDWFSQVAAQTNAKPVRLGDDDPPSQTCKALYSCEDCYTARICRPTENGIVSYQSIPCPKDRPFCDADSGSCVAQEPLRCGDHNDPFICMGDGLYPDQDCHKFHACLNYQPVTFQCPENTAYDPKTKKCLTTASCSTFDCDSMPGGKVSHNSDGAYFAFCATMTNSLLVVDSCPPAYALNATSQLCEPECAKDGLVADAHDCHFYHKCTTVTVRPGITYVDRVKLQCPEKQAYSTEDFLCVDEANVKSCKNRT